MSQSLDAEVASLPSAFETAADLGRRDSGRVPDPYSLEPDTSIVVVRVRNDETIQTHDLERYLEVPRTTRGHADLHDPDGFIAYVNRLSDTERTTVWADEKAGTITAVLDDHADADAAGWRQHTVKLTLRADEDWQRWVALDRKLSSHQEFADFIDGNYHVITRPDAATMREVSTSMQAKRNVTFNSQVRLDNNDVQLTYVENTTAQAGKNGSLEVPREFDIQLSPFVGCDPIPLTARLRYAIVDGHLRLGFVLIRPDLARLDVFESTVRKIHDELLGDIPVLYGTAPASLR
jgi:uncharacterized protein YfdQ (DUF2303 family)